ncbi:MAG: phosphoribosyltransferase [Trueperaceae bacterium]|nr:phosphoribosyltransferase [Trueperaceae bacterium]
MTDVATKVALELPDIAMRLKILDLPQVDVVVGIATGGIVPASLVAFHLGLPLEIMQINFRAADNKPQRPQPELLASFRLEGQKRVLLVDDVSVTGSTFQVAKNQLKNHHVTTLAIKGKADYVLYENLPSCILLPWRDY